MNGFNNKMQKWGTFLDTNDPEVCDDVLRRPAWHIPGM